MIHLFPEDANLKVQLGTTRVRRGDQAGARRVLEPLTVDRQDNIRGLAHYQLARGYFEENHFRAALKHLEAAGSSDPQVLADAAPLELKARVHEKLGQKEEAIATYREVLALEPDAPDALVPLIRLELEENQTRDALDHLRRFTLAALKEPAELPLAAELHLRMNRLEDAFELAVRAREAGIVVNSQRVLGLVYLRKKDLDKAVFHLERADLDADVLEGLIRAYLLLGDLPKALRHFEAAQSLDEGKDTPGLREVMGRVQTLVSRREQLSKEIKPAQDKKAQTLAALNPFLCADLAYRDPATRGEAARLLGGSFKEGALLGPAFALRGLLHLEKGNLKAALADAQKALTLKPVDARAYYVRGRVRLERGEAGALGDLERAATLTRREDGVILHWLAGALFEAGRFEDALTVQRRAVELRPQDALVAEQLRAFEKASRQKIGDRR
jgi:tetratricopeptide (TPR) repeat protein